MGIINFALFNAAKRITEWKHDWEKAYVLGSDDYVFRNTFTDIRYILETMGGEGSKFEHECYDVGHLYNLAYFVDQALVKARSEEPTSELQSRMRISYAVFCSKKK